MTWFVTVCGNDSVIAGERRGECRGMRGKGRFYIMFDK